MIEPTAHQSGMMIGKQLAALQDLLGSEQGKSIRAAFLKRGIMQLTREPPASARQRPRLRYFDTVLAGVRKELGGSLPVVAGESGGQKVIWTLLPDTGEWVGLPLPHPAIDPMALVGLWLGVLLLIALGAATLSVYFLERPLRRLVGAMGHFSQGYTPSPLPVTGPEEVRKLTRGFNRMVQELSIQEQDRGLFLAGISHDLRTPLTRLGLALEMMESKDPELTEEALQNVADMENIVAQFMDYLQGEEEESPRPCDLGVLFRHTLSRYRDRGVNIDMQFPQNASLGMPCLRPGAIRRLLTNLLDNALHHGGGDICLESGISSDGREYWFRVADRGPGIPLGEQERVLFPYVRLQHGIPVPGSGLGLAIVQRIARAEGLSLRLFNREGGGLVVELRGSHGKCPDP
ncbi:ATP-binding protein [Thiolapillus brandeum]|nr:ATP-binding protein [Thiolapillus brandeum]